ncbi:MAG: thiamine-phosphate kinase [Nitrososphaerota archaeon]|uniref:thiamine-phosphate kinase n=1 Tax=Candidatus Bathycorpusculum sp. TaxID=2994959 RepID=UPI00282AE53F|nr:thiamine-phosphate kinase [Candidatus Termiticorpusculum sp.]MCL2257358.1 thiamine-phosphate kinase [Candidatus Termiticorpusculum sp.]MCL2291670.1 thiamine-phosphate kinase [Candidatus Termiticorpusculum sp.]MDR0459993.1 thiamine-phosphate kinase [Nitrososphaerota archaeon]
MNSSDCLGEREIISLLHQRLSLMPDMPVPFGDDVSAVSIGDGYVVVLKTDMLVAKTDVPVSMSLFCAARKAIVMNVSDFASKGVQPIAAMVALGLPKNLATQTAVAEIADGLNDAVREYGAYVIGGDIGETDDLTISVSLYGKAKHDALMLRSGAMPGDILAVTGLFGKSAAGLQLLLDKSLSVPSKTRLVLEHAVFVPCARLVEGLALSKSGCVSASMDSSDGLAWSLYELMRMSDVGFIVETLPVATAVTVFAEQNGLNAEQLVLYGGEEYELVLTINPKNWETAKAAVEAIGGNLIAIGRATVEKQLILLTVDCKKRQIEPCGYEHFKTQV